MNIIKQLKRCRPAESDATWTLTDWNGMLRLQLQKRLPEEPQKGQQDASSEEVEDNTVALEKQLAWAEHRIKELEELIDTVVRAVGTRSLHCQSPFRPPLR